MKDQVKVFADGSVTFVFGQPGNPVRVYVNQTEIDYVEKINIVNFNGTSSIELTFPKSFDLDVMKSIEENARIASSCNLITVIRT